MRPSLLVSLLAIFSPALGGCASNGRDIKLPSYQPGDTAIISRTPSAGIYQVKWLPSSNAHATVLPDTTVYLHKGSPLGFKTDTDRTPVAIGGEYELKLSSLPPSGRKTRLVQRAVTRL